MTCKRQRAPTKFMRYERYRNGGWFVIEILIPTLNSNRDVSRFKSEFRHGTRTIYKGEHAYDPFPQGGSNFFRFSEIVTWLAVFHVGFCDLQIISSRKGHIDDWDWGRWRVIVRFNVCIFVRIFWYNRENYCHELSRDENVGTYIHQDLRGLEK